MIPIPPHAVIFMFDAPSLTNAPTNRRLPQPPKDNYFRILEQSDMEENRSFNKYSDGNSSVINKGLRIVFCPIN